MPLNKIFGALFHFENLKMIMVSNRQGVPQSMSRWNYACKKNGGGSKFDQWLTHN